MLLADGLADRWGLADRLERGSLAVIVKRSPPVCREHCVIWSWGKLVSPGSGWLWRGSAGTGESGTTTGSFSVFEAVTGGQDLLFH